MREIARSGSEAKPDSTISQVIEFAQDKQHTLSEVTLDASMIAEREIKLQKVSGVVKIVTKLDGTLYTVTLT